MIFKPEMVEKILAGEKSVTRRPVKPGNSLHGPDCRPCKYKVGKDYAVQPGRGQKAVARIRVVAVQRTALEPSNYTLSLLVREGRREGFADWQAFRDYWRALYRSFDATQLVDRIEFELLGLEADE